MFSTIRCPHGTACTYSDCPFLHDSLEDLDEARTEDFQLNDKSVQQKLDPRNKCSDNKIAVWKLLIRYE